MSYAKKSLGQHFLHSDSDLERMVDEAGPSALSLILEIGPGKGALTEKLIPFVGKIVAVEKDDELIEFLKNKFKDAIDNNRLELIHEDILKFDPNILEFYKDLDYQIVANIPYNITGAILKKFLSASFQPSQMVLLVQKEVAERIVAKDGKESILSISIKAYGVPKYIKTVKAGSFNPPPKVDSAIIRIDEISRDFFKDFTEKEFFEMIRTGFKSKRKKLSSNLSEIYEKKLVLGAFSTLKLDPNLRAEDVSLETWKKIGVLLAK
jgi:16S rRNA (adenine1518-N6/adenine1519-N6)-dimethyltransferase